MSRIQNEATVTRMARAKALAKRSGKVVGYTVGAALVAGAAYSAYQVFKAGGADAAASAVGSVAEAASEAVVETVAAALRG